MFSWSCGFCHTWARCLEPSNVPHTTERNHCSLRCGGSCRRALQQQLVPSAVTLSSVSPTSAGVTTTKVSLLSPLGTLWPEHPQLTLCIWMFLWANPTHCSYLLQISTFFLSLPLSAFLSTLSLWPYSVFITLHCLNIPSKTWVLQKRNPNAKRRQKYLIHKQLVCRNPGVIT